MKSYAALLILTLFAGAHIYAQTSKGVITENGFISAVIDADDNARGSLLISELEGDRGIEQLPLTYLGRSYQNVPFRFDVTKGRLYFIMRSGSTPGIALFFIRKLLLDDIRTANLMKPEQEKKFVGMAYNGQGVLILSQLGVAPLDDAYRTAPAGDQGSLVSWDLRARWDDDVRLYILSRGTISVWLAPAGDWKSPLKAGPWKKLAEYQCELGLEFTVLSDDETSLVLATSDKGVVVVSGKGVRPFSDPSASQFSKGGERWAILDKMKNRTILAIGGSLGNGVRDYLVFEGASKQGTLSDVVLKAKLQKALRAHEEAVRGVKAKTSGGKTP